MDGTRVDKWLWAARFFKTREQASKACELGRVTSNAVRAKPAREVRAGDMLRIQKEDGEREVEVLALSQQRGRAAVAQTLYRETEASIELRRKAAEERRHVPLLARRRRRGRAAVAQTLYRETEASIELRRKAAEERRLLGPMYTAAAPTGRPGKRDRRLIHSFVGKR